MILSVVYLAPNRVVAVDLITFILRIVLNKTPLGEYIVAVGGKEEAARIAGVPVAKTEVATFVI